MVDNNRNGVRNGERSPYEDFKAMLLCHHEAGHAVVGHVIGVKLQWVRAGRELHRMCHAPVSIRRPEFTADRKERARRIAGLRRMITLAVAGHVADTIHQQDVVKRGYSCREESRAYRMYWQFRVSNMFSIGQTDEPTSDLFEAVRDATSICYSNVLGLVNVQDPTTKALKKMQRASATDLTKDIKAEIERAEARAERILLRHWEAVTDIATSLHRSKNGHLDRRQLLRRLDYHGVPHGDA
jgi:hypothetical protein